MTEARETIASDAEVGLRSHRLLEMCLIVGVPPKTLRQMVQDLQNGGVDSTDVTPEILSIHAPPFVGPQANSLAHSQSSLRKPEEITGPAFSSGQLFGNMELFKEHLSSPRGIELCGLPELCFPEGSELADTLSETFTVLVPYGICVITKFPYYTVLKDCLSCLLLDLKSCGERELEMKVKEFAAQLALVPCPPPGSLQL
ncbi:hypothetical protein scyTo_0013013, partial [Scyliorhinus torazame]|nr:hypothetical protein [Scyliorhinus torazame]